MRGRRRWTLLFVAALSLLALGSATYEESFVHTDDGCEVEIHCLACRLAVASAPEAPAPPPALLAPQATGLDLRPAAEARPPDRSARPTQPRAPPSA